MKTVQPDRAGLKQAAELIHQGLVVAYPTETVYGLGVDPFSIAAVKRLYELKGRQAASALILIVADTDQLEQVVSEVTPRAMGYIRTFWPGPLSLLLPRCARLPGILTGGSPNVCVRCPACQTARDLCREIGAPITSTSANLSGHPPARDVSAAMLPGVALGIDGGTLAPSLPSTVFNPDTNEVFREGAVSCSQLARLSGD
jgi:L-threonylcarbamoyladenylate synthase